jgi:dTDP-4-dehydrorhamnose reductase
MRILITGSNGLLGQKIVRQLKGSKIDFLATSKGQNRNSKCNSSNYKSLDITSEKDVNILISNYKPTHIINTAAITNVDFCEDNQELCYKVNVDAVAIIFNVCIEKKMHFIQLSTDFVFDGENGPYSEDDLTNPLSIYAKSKNESENILKNSKYKKWSILRTIIVYGEGENLSRSNIVLWAKSALEKGVPLTIVDDQFRSPTWADDLAWSCIQTVKEKAYGIYHISGPTIYSIYDLVSVIADYYGYDRSLIKAVKSNTLNQKAKRPPSTGFVLNKARTELNYNPKSLIETLNYLT